MNRLMCFIVWILKEYDNLPAGNIILQPQRMTTMILRGRNHCVEVMRDYVKKMTTPNNIAVDNYTAMLQGLRKDYLQAALLYKKTKTSGAKIPTTGNKEQLIERVKEHYTFKDFKRFVQETNLQESNIEELSKNWRGR